MPWTLLKLANKARSLPEFEIVLRLGLGLIGGFLLARVALNAFAFGDLTITDLIGLVVIAAAGAWLVHAAVRWRE